MAGLQTSPQVGRHSPEADRRVRRWLFAVAMLVFAMVVVGGATRLTDSGLSITEWKPIVGAIPPLSESDWAEAFQKYQQIPEFHHVNRSMTLEGFKVIFWWEWGHRFLGRIIGLAFALPLLVFWARGDLRPGLGGQLTGLLALGGLQGAIGWYMVSSGLVDRVDVSQYRLALHLGTALLIFGLLLWTAFGLGARGASPGGLSAGERRFAPVVAGAVFVQILLGAFVAGLKAGLAYNTWPTMDGAWLPDGLLRLSPLWLNLFENETLVQFNHRLGAYVVLGLVVAQAVSLWRSRDRHAAAGSAMLVLAAVVAQAGIGIATLLLAVPLWLGLLHQAGAVIVLGLAVRHWHIVRGHAVGAGVV